MKKLIGLLAAIGAAATILFFWRKNQKSWSSTWSCGRDTASSWGTTVADEGGKAADKVAAAADGASDAASDVADRVKTHSG